MNAMADAFLIAVDSVVDLLDRPEVADGWGTPSALAEWSVGGLAAHLADQAVFGHSLLTAEESASPPIPLDEHYLRAAWVTAEVGDEVNVGIRAGGERAAAAGPDALRARVLAVRDELPAVFAATQPERAVLIPWQGWALRRDDFLTTRMMEITVHGDDLAASVGVPPPALPDAVLGPVLGLLTRLAVRRHGQSAVVAALSRAERAPATVTAF
jgi:Mycothiol maleylpyruvate isomerase N-terminal domain